MMRDVRACWVVKRHVRLYGVRGHEKYIDSGDRCELSVMV
jgi:hypothetical protein